MPPKPKPRPPSPLLLEGKLWDMFIDSLKTERTKEIYTASLQEFASYHKIKSLEELLNDPEAKDKIIDYIDYLKKGNYSYTHQNIASQPLAREKCIVAFLHHE